MGSKATKLGNYKITQNFQFSNISNLKYKSDHGMCLKKDKDKSKCIWWSRQWNIAGWYCLLTNDGTGGFCGTVTTVIYSRRSHQSDCFQCSSHSSHFNELQLCFNFVSSKRVISKKNTNQYQSGIGKVINRKWWIWSDKGNIHLNHFETWDLKFTGRNQWRFCETHFANGDYPREPA